MTWLSSSSTQNSSTPLSIQLFSAHVPVKEVPTLLCKAKFSLHTVPIIGRQRYWIISSKLTRNFETEKQSRQFHKVQLWSLSWVTYTQAGRIRPTGWSRGIRSCTLHHGKGYRGSKGARAKHGIWLPSEKHDHTDGDRGFSPPPGISGPLTICVSIRHSSSFHIRWRQA